MTSLCRKSTTRWKAALALCAFAGLHGLAMAQNGDARALDKGGKADATPEQRYQSAIREAGGGLKVGLEECKQAPAADRSACNAAARQRYKDDMDQARAMRKDPSARPVNVQGEPIRSTETTTILRP